MSDATLFIFLTLISVFFSGCSGFDLPDEAYVSGTIEGEVDEFDMSSWEVDPQFSFPTAIDVPLEVTAINNAGAPLTNVPIRISYKVGGESEYRYMLSGATDQDGHFESCVFVDQNIDTFLFETSYPGFPGQQLLAFSGGAVQYTFDPKRTPITPNGLDSSGDDVSTFSAQMISTTEFDYMGTYSSNGVPDYLEPTDDVVSQDVLDLIAASLPEGQPVPAYNPQYISSGNTASLIVEDDLDLWVTFVHEGAGYRNALGYYTYPTSNPPSDTSEIDALEIVFPNVSFSGSGGGMTTGNKVFLGSFDAGTSVGWFLVPNGWSNADQEVIPQDGKDMKFSNSILNEFTNEENQSHSVILEDSEAETLYLGFEDINRPGGDRDFNDAVFYLTATPYSSINTSGLPQAQASTEDSDGDGAPDNTDEFVDDPNIAFATHVPGAGLYGSLSYEDMWPSTGDYDMNDMVVDYNFIDYRNSDNLVIKTRATIVLKAMGAGLRNGFGYATELSPSDIASVNGHQLFENYIDLAANGVESGQTNAVFIAFDNGFKLMGNPIGFVNTDPLGPVVEPDTVQLDITYSTPLQAGSIGAPPYNPFIMTGLRRGYEVHLPDLPPTDKADLSLFQTQADDSEPSSGRYYKTANNLPWALNFTSGFDYPLEKKTVNTAYHHFFEWVTSSGLDYPDWYYNINGYRNSPLIY